jgi:hypothetical protein
MSLLYHIKLQDVLWSGAGIALTTEFRVLPTGSAGGMM